MRRVLYGEKDGDMMAALLDAFGRRDDLRKFAARHGIYRGKDKNDTAINIAMDPRTRLKVKLNIRSQS